MRRGLAPMRLAVLLAAGATLALGACNALSGLGDLAVGAGGGAAQTSSGGGGGGKGGAGGSSASSSSSSTSTSSTSSTSSGGGCTSANDCPGADDFCSTRTCTSGACGVIAVNGSMPLPPAQQTKGDCVSLACDGQGHIASTSDPSDLPDDGNACTVDTCQSGAPSFAPALADTACTSNGGQVCDNAGNCVECNSNGECGDICVDHKCVASNCNDNVKNGSETDVDCGPGCSPCDAGKVCVSHANCASEACLGGTCAGIAQIAVGIGQACARTTAGDLYCWGQNLQGELGDGTMIANPQPVKVQVSGVTRVVLGSRVKLGEYDTHVCALVAGGAVACWGYGASGQLGQGSQTSLDVPANVPGVTATALAAGGRHTCAVAADHSAQCWGSDSFAQLGDGTTTDSYAPIPAQIADALAVSLGTASSCVLTTIAEVRCWGANGSGEIGLGDVVSPVYTPTLVPGLSNVKEISLGRAFACARTADGGVSCWGDNSDGELGLGNKTGQQSPSVVPNLTGVTQIAAGVDRDFNSTGGHTCAVMADTTVRCWGEDDHGQVGDGVADTNDRLAPLAVPNLAGVVEVACGGDFTCARLASGALRCWGANDVGQLGNAAPGGDALTPTPVVWP